MASIMKKSKVPGGGHILVTPQDCFDDNWQDKEILLGGETKRLGARYSVVILPIFYTE